jgi:hypothetical protein
VLYCNIKKRKLVNYEIHMNEQRIHDKTERRNVSQKISERRKTQHIVGGGCGTCIEN